MIILGIETSCDETSASIVQNGRYVLSNIIASQIDIHAPFGGVVPELAARSHISNINFIVNASLDEAKLDINDIDAYAVTNGPGLAGALLVGLNYAKGLAFATKKPIIGVNHIEGHVSANYIDTDLQPPFLSLVVSGGHTSLIAVDSYTKHTTIGSTKDDAVGEVFDKIARIMNLGYPGGPIIDNLAENGDINIKFPIAKIDGLNFSFSGLKTAVMQFLQKNNDIKKEDCAASFRQAIINALIEKTSLALDKYKTLTISGGVACNIGLRRAMDNLCKDKGVKLFMPKPIYCTDNAAMIASQGYFALQAKKSDGLDLNAFPRRRV